MRVTPQKSGKSEIIAFPPRMFEVGEAFIVLFLAFVTRILAFGVERIGSDEENRYLCGRL